MAQLQQLEFSAIELELAARFTERGLRLVATPGRSDVFETWTGARLKWERIERIYPVPPLPWWRNLPSNRVISQAHMWLGDKGYLRRGRCSMGRLFVVGDSDLALPSEPAVEFLADEPNRDLRTALVHLDLYSA